MKNEPKKYEEMTPLEMAKQAAEAYEAARKYTDANAAIALWEKAFSLALEQKDMNALKQIAEGILAGISELIEDGKAARLRHRAWTMYNSDPAVPEGMMTEKPMSNRQMDERAASQKPAMARRNLLPVLTSSRRLGGVSDGGRALKPVARASGASAELSRRRKKNRDLEGPGGRDSDE